LDIFKKYGVSKDINVHMSSGLYEIITTGLTINEFAYVPLVYVNKVRLTGVDYAIKATMDYLITIPLLILLSPLLLGIAIAIRLDSPGKVIYRRAVMGLNGGQFYAYKFRTMYINGDEILLNYPELREELAHNHKLKKDPRVTRVGRFIRKYSLDELPQLINVLLRNMSLVGPRMISPEEVAMYKQFNINLLTCSIAVLLVSGR
jgi:lipopolysaccharide/colanic/teichoic acid biosynthesis glycosyltransferase